MASQLHSQKGPLRLPEVKLPSPALQEVSGTAAVQLQGLTHHAGRTLPPPQQPLL